MHRTLLLPLLTVFMLIFQAFSGVMGDAASMPDPTPDSASVNDLERYLEELYQQVISDSSLSFEVFQLGVIGHINLFSQGKLSKPNLLTIIDFSQPSNQRRLYTIDIQQRRLTHNLLVAHGMSTGNVTATHFSNKSGSKMSSLGFYITAETYDGKHDYSMKLDGQEPGFNSAARSRGIVMHGASYVSESYISQNGRLGRSFGCPAVDDGINHELVNHIKDGSTLFIFAEQQTYLRASKLLNRSSASKVLPAFKQNLGN